MFVMRALASSLVAICFLTGQTQAQPMDEWWDWALPQVLQGQVVETSLGYTVVVGDEGIQPISGNHDPEEEIFRGSGAGVLELSVPCRTAVGWPNFHSRKCRSQALETALYSWDRVLIERLAFAEESEQQYLLDAPALRALLGDRGVRRLELEGVMRGVSGELSARWIETNRPRARALQIRAAGQPLAELTDYDGDDYVDVALVHRGQ